MDLPNGMRYWKNLVGKCRVTEFRLFRFRIKCAKWCDRASFGLGIGKVEEGLYSSMQSYDTRLNLGISDFDLRNFHKLSILDPLTSRLNSSTLLMTVTPLPLSLVSKPYF